MLPRPFEKLSILKHETRKKNAKKSSGNLDQLQKHSKKEREMTKMSEGQLMRYFLNAYDFNATEFFLNSGFSKQVRISLFVF